MQKKLLFVCLGNICRSPAAEGIMAKLLADAGMAEKVFCDSAGTSALHKGAPADGRMISFARERGYDLASRSRPFNAREDFTKFDYILTMDTQNYDDVRALDNSALFHGKIIPIVEYCRVHEVKEVPDPYYEGDDGFRLVLDILEDACGGFLERLQREIRKG
jgi:protein-tyrosine phosphatase